MAADPVSWLLIEPGWRVMDAKGAEIGTVDEVRGDKQADIFDGLMVRASTFGEATYVSADDVGEIVDGTVHLT